jgi:hypothetical protein
MAQRVFLHVGTMKSGTSYLQALWWHHRRELARRGLLVPGDKQFDHRFAALIVRDGVELAAKRLNLRQIGVWKQILAHTAATTGDVIISNEVFCVVDAARAGQALRQLGDAAEEVHVVVTTRDLARILASAWQQRIRHGSSASFEAFWQEIATEGPDGPFRLRYDVPGLLDRWASDLDPGRVHVVVHPRRGAPPEWLWQRLCELTAVDPSGLATDVGRPNQSLGLVEIELLRAVNASLKSLRPRRRGRAVRFLRHGLVSEVLLPAGGERCVVPHEAYSWAIEKGRSAADDLRARDWHIVGDLADLVPDPGKSGRTPDDVTDAEIRQVALRSLVHEVVRGSTQQQQLLELREEVRELRRSLRARRDGPLHHG